jgi:predicted phage terminase large subunit-like protein
VNSSESKSPRRCPTCQKTEPEASFYKKAEDCRACILLRAWHEPKEGLESKVEKHRREKLLRAELRKIAKKEVEKRQHRRRSIEKKKAVERMMPKTEEGQVEVDAATKELARRVLQRRRLIEFVKAFHPRYKAGWVHYDICRRLEKFTQDVIDGKSPRLMLLMPPRHGKSQLASKLWPSWHLGQAPFHEIIACSYAVSLPLDFSREVRGIIRSDKYAKLFPDTQLDPVYQAAEAWKLTSPTGVGGGGYVAAGVGGPITGKGAHVLVIDDPIKNAEEASSVEHLRKVMEWYDSTAYTRLAPGGGVLVIMTWWSDMDPAGVLQERMRADPEADQFEVVKYPAIATEDEEFRVKGEALHPDRYPVEQLMKIKNTLGGDTGRFWNALYQQNPVPDEGAMFTKDMFVWRNERPQLDHCHIYQAWDFAIGEKRTNDWTVGVTVAVDFDDNAHVMEVVRFRSGDQLKIANEMLDMYDRYPNVMLLGAEDGQIWRGVKGHLEKRMRERRLTPVVEELKPLTDKLVRCLPLQGRMKQRKVTFPRSGGWVGDLQKEFLRFPAGMHDDQVDALSWCTRLFLSRAAPRRPAYKGPAVEETLAKKLRRLGSVPGGTGHMLA